MGSLVKAQRAGASALRLELARAEFDDVDFEPSILRANATRDPRRRAQRLQKYLGYTMFRYRENLKPGSNGGGQVETGDARALPLDLRQLQYEVRDHCRAEWAGTGTSFDEMVKRASAEKENGPEGTTIGPAVG